jgi:hypothetical protein
MIALGRGISKDPTALLVRALVDFFSTSNGERRNALLAKLTMG